MDPSAAEPLADPSDAEPLAPGAEQAARARPWAWAAFLLAVTSALLAWWRVTWSSGDAALRDEVRLFRPEPPLTTAWGPWLTGALVAAAVVILFVRLAARSDRHEPPAWHRDLGVATVLLAAALASGLLWPADVPAFWGGRTYTAENVTTEVTETAVPGLGWWVAAAASLACLAAWRVSRHRGAPAARPRVTCAWVGHGNPLRGVPR